MNVLAKILKIRLCVSLLLLLISQNSSASFSLGSFLGDLNSSSAGGAAAVNDAKTAFTNPAGLTQLGGTQWVVESLYFRPSVKFSNNGSVDVFSAPTSGGEGGNGASNTPIPNIYFSYSISPNMTAGLSINVPFGLTTKWDEDWVGRYHAIETGIKTLNFSPAIGFKIDDQWSVGAALNLHKTSATLSKALDFGVICLGGPAPGICGGLGLGAPQVADGLLELEGSDWSVGYTLGVLMSVDKTRVGFSYRSRVDHTLVGNADFTNPALPAPFAAAIAPAFTDSDGEVSLTLPAVMSLSVHHQLLPILSLMADFTITKWSSFKEVKVDFDNPAQPTDITPKNWKDTRRIALGLDYMLNSTTSMQGGIAKESSAIPDSTFDPSIPVTDGSWINIGVRHALSNKVRLDVAYTYGFFEERDVNITGSMSDTLIGKLKPVVDVISLKLSGEF